MNTDQLSAIRARFDSGLSLEYEQVDALLGEVERLAAELHQMKSRPCEAEFSRLDVAWRQLSRERDEAVFELRRLRGDRSEVNSAKIGAAFTEGTLAAGDAMRSQIATAFRRGAEAMREAALAACWHHGAMYLHKQIGDLPIPEDKP